MNKRITDVDIVTIANVLKFFVNDGENIAQVDKKELFDAIKPDLSEYAKSVDVNAEIDKLKKTDSEYADKLNSNMHYTSAIANSCNSNSRAIKNVNDAMIEISNSCNSNNSDIKKINNSMLEFDYEDIVADRKFYINKAGLYIFVGYDYCLNFYNSSGGNDFNIVGNKNNLVMGIIATQNKHDSRYLRAFYGKTYQNTLKIASVESDVIDLYNDTANNKHAYVHNTHSKNNSVVLYLRAKN